MNNTHNSNNRLLKTSLAMLIALSLAGCATGGKVDPYENVNRDIFEFNDTVDGYVAKPISDAYKWVTPQFVQTGIFNFFNNLKNVNVIINDVLQAKFQQSAEDTGRLLINSTAGLGGLIDVAQEVGLKQNDEDFDQTLAVWGVPEGPYMVLPLLGPTTLRGIPGAILDAAASPTSYTGLPVQLVSLLNTRANAQSSLDMVQEGALDPYVFIREGFLQSREHLATDGKKQVLTDVDDLDLNDSSSVNTSTTKTSSSSDSSAPASNNSDQNKYKLELSSAESSASIGKPKTKSLPISFSADTQPKSGN